MSILNIQEQITGGESVYCINEAQIRLTQGLMNASDDAGERLRSILDNLEKELSRNERAALAFTIIERLNGNL